MMMIEHVTDAATGKQVTMLHDKTQDQKNHTVTILEPNPAAGPFAGKIIASYRMNAEQARELKNHL